MVAPPELAVLPWELLYSPTRDTFLGTSIQTALVRYLRMPEPIRLLPVQPPLRMLAVVPCNPDLDTAAEKQRLVEALGDVEDLVEVTWLEGTDRPVTRTALHEALLAQPYDLLHFIGHGAYRDEQAVLFLNDADGRPDPLPHTVVGQLLQNHPSMKLAFLNACQGAAVSAVTPLLGVAPQLVRRGVPAVVAMQYPVYDDVAIHFARTFYQVLFRGPNQGRVDVAMAQARNGLAVTYPDERAMAAPVLFMRAPNGVLFKPPRRGGVAQVFSAARLHTEAEALRTQEQSVADLERMAPDEGGGERLEEEVRELRAMKRDMAFRKTALLSAVGLAVLLFPVAWVALLDVLTLETRAELATLWLADLFTGESFSDEIAIVGVDEQSEQALGEPWGVAWRRHHARLIDRLCDAGASVVGMDMTFSSSSEHDVELRAAMTRAAERGTRVVVGVKELGLGADPQPRIAEGLREAGELVRWGVVCLDERLGYVVGAPLAVRAERVGVRSATWPGFALACLVAARREGREGSAAIAIDDAAWEVSTGAGDRMRTWDCFDVRVAGREQTGCPIITEGATVASIALDVSSAAVLHDPARRLRYEKVLDTDPADLEDLEKVVEGRIVLVGVTGAAGGADRKHLLRGLWSQPRWGVELHADALNALLQERTIRRQGMGGEILLLVAVSLAGSGVRIRWARAATRKRRGVLAGTGVVLVVVTILSYGQLRVLINLLDGMLLLLLAYWVTGHIERRWFP